MTADRWNRIINYPRKYDLWIAAALTLFSAVCYSQTKGPSLDCRSGHAKVSDAYRPADSSTVALKLSCAGNKVRIVLDNLYSTSFEGN